MSDIPNIEYITVKADGVFVGEKPATYYRGVKICSCKSINTNFLGILKQYPNIQEMRFLTSETGGKYLANGNPVVKNGSNAWACVKFNDGYVSPWTLVSEYPYDFFINHELCGKLRLMVDNPQVYLNPVLGSYQDVIVRINLQNMNGKSFDLNGYRITIQKISEQHKGR